MTAEEVVVVLTARMDKLERDIGQAANKFDAGTTRMKRAGSDLQRSLESNSAGISSAFKSMAATIGAYFTGRELAGLIDGFTRFQNQLKTAGVEASNFGKTQGDLFAIAQRYGVQLEAVGTLYGRNAAAAKELNLSQKDQLKIVEATSAALKISGTSAGEAAGTLLQLSQVLGGTNVQAEEYNSLIDGARPLLQAVAEGNSKWGGSVAALTRDVKAGNVSVREFVDSLLKGAPAIIDRAADATLTLSGASQALTNALTVYVGEAAQANGVTNALASGINALANNLNTVIPALAIIGTGLAVGLVANAVAATGSVGALGTALLRAFGGPVGIAITALTVGLGALAVEAAQTSSLVQAADTAAAAYKKTLIDAAGAAHSAAGGQAAVGEQSAAAVSKIDNFAGATGRAAAQLYNLARAQRAAALGDLVGKKQAVDSRLDELAARSPAGRNQSADQFRRGDFLNNLGVIGRAASGTAMNVLTGGRSDRDINRAIGETIAERDRLAKAIDKLKAAPLESFVPTSGGGGGVPSVARGGSRRNAAVSGGSASAPKSPLNPEAFARELAQADAELLAARQSSTASAEDQAKLDIQRIDQRRDAQIREAGADKRLTVAQKGELDFKYRAIAEEQKLGVELAERRRVEDEAVQLASVETSAQRDLLQGKLALADTDKERRKIARQIIDLEFKEKERALRRITESDTATPFEKKVATAQLGKLGEMRTQADAGADRDNEGPLDRYKRQLHKSTDDMNEALENVEVNGLRSLEDGLLGIINGTESVGSAFKKMATSIIADLARIAIEKAIVAAISSIGLGFADGGEVRGFADGGSPGGRISGPGTGRSDSILAILGGRNGAIRVSNGEYIVNEQATRRHLPLLEAINSNRVRGFADGGVVATPMRPLDMGGLMGTNGRVAARTAGTTIIHAPTTILKSPVVTSDLIAEIDARNQASLRAASPHIAQAGADQAMKQMARQQQLGSTGSRLR